MKTISIDWSRSLDPTFIYRTPQANQQIAAAILSNSHFTDYNLCVWLKLLTSIASSLAVLFNDLWNTMNAWE